MATLTVLQATRSGPRYDNAFVAAAAGGDDFPNDGKTILLVNNAGGASINCSFVPLVDLQAGDPLQDTTQALINVVLAQRHVIGPFPTNIYGASVAITYSGVTSVTVALIQVG